jgi:hypothetical protein
MGATDNTGSVLRRESSGGPTALPPPEAQRRDLALKDGDR